MDMKYTIKVNNDIKRITNPLLHLDGNRYDTREAACEAIYAAMYDVIDNYYGCEMVAKPDVNGLEDDALAKVLDDYESACRDYIMREGYATEDGVSATVEEWTSTKTVRTADEIVDDWKRDNPDYEFVKIEFTADAVKIYYKGEIGITGETYEDVEEISAHLIAVAFGDDEGEIDVAAQTVTTWED